MSTRKKFAIPPEQLRENFVQAKLAETQAFNQAGIEEWLAAQRNAIKPDIDGWERLQSLGRTETEDSFPDGWLELLSKCATPYLDREHLYAASQWSLETFAGMVQRDRPIYLAREMHTKQGSGFPVAYVSTDDEGGFFVWSTTESELLLKYADDDENWVPEWWPIQTILFHEWEDGRPNWEAARTFLCDMLGRAIQKLRKLAEDDYNKAVAVSSDGLKIFPADFVHVCMCDGSSLTFPAAAFSDHKILRVDYKICHSTLSPTSESLEDIHAALLKTACSMYEQHRFNIIPPDWRDYPERPRLNVFVTRESWCPDPLPDGGYSL